MRSPWRPITRSASDRWRRADRPLVFGHRGAMACATENTVESFQLARDAGADGVELDVHVCGTGEMVVFHDGNLRRLAGRSGRVDELSFGALRSTELEDGGRIPTLDEVFECVGDEMLVNIELKTGGTPLIRQALACVARHAAEERVVFSSFDPRLLARVRLRAPSLRTALLFHAGQSAPLRRAWVAPVLAPFAVHPDHRLVTAETMRQWRAHGWLVNVWTVNQAKLLSLLVGLGVDGVFTNDPAATLGHLTRGRSTRGRL